MKKITIYLLFVAAVFCGGIAENAAAQTDAENIANAPAIIKTDCRNRLGKAMESLCESDAAYKACLGYLKAGKWNYCARGGVAGSQARRIAPAEAYANLLKEKCKELVSGRFVCPNRDFNLSSAYTNCVAYFNGTGAVKECIERKFLDEYADRIEAKLKGKPVGYAFVITNRDGERVERAWDAARKAPDKNPSAMTVNAEYSLASVSKNITAAATLKLLASKNIALTTPVWSYFPADWKVADSFKSVTFADLLKHRSGIRCDGAFGQVTYDNLKKCVETGIFPLYKTIDCDQNKLTDTISIGCYQNHNYALMRVLIPRVNGFNEPNAAKAAESYAREYRNYVAVNVFAKAGFGAQCRPTDGDKQPLTYKLSAPNGNGGDFGDMSLVCGSQGWFVSAKHLADYFYTLNNSEAILPGKLSEQMMTDLIGYTGTGAVDTPFGKSFRWWHNGYHPASMNPGEINTLLLRFSNGVQLAFIMNSDAPAGTNYGNDVTNAFYETMQPQK